MERSFTIEEARDLLSGLRPDVDELIRLRADLTAAVRGHEQDGPTAPLADLKAMEARLSELLDGFAARGIQVKGWAPLLLDFPAWLGERELLLCWLEGEAELAWYHDVALGFAGRRPLTELGW